MATTQKDRELIDDLMLENLRQADYIRALLHKIDTLQEEVNARAKVALAAMAVDEIYAVSRLQRSSRTAANACPKCGALDVSCTNCGTGWRQS